jgi:hypothetical protein
VRVRQSNLARLKVRNSFSLHAQIVIYVPAGRWPVKSVNFMLRLLKNAESNADAKSLDAKDLIIKNIVVQQAPVCPLCLALERGHVVILVTENQPQNIPSTRSHQRLHGAPLSRRNHPVCQRGRSGEEQRQGCVKFDWAESAASCQETSRGCPKCVTPASLAS